jgi:hypothetical protein
VVTLAFLAAAATTPPAQPRLQDVLRDVTGGCDRPADGAIIVCGQRDRESPYRVPRALRDTGFDPDGPVDSVSRERHKLMEGGESGIHSCSNTGAGGWTGCMLQGWGRSDQQRGYQSPSREPKR